MKKIILLRKSHIDTYTRKDGTVVASHDDKRTVKSVNPMPKAHAKLHQDAEAGVAHSEEHAAEHKRLVDMYHNSSADWERQAANRLISKNLARAESKPKKQNTTENAFSAVSADEIMLHEDKLRNVFSFVGGGVDDISDDSHKTSASRGGKMESYWSNEVDITFNESDSGGIDKRHWDRVEQILDGMTGKNGLNSYRIDASSNKINLSFDQDKPIGMY